MLCLCKIIHTRIISEIKYYCLAANAVTLARRAAPVPDQAPIRKNLTSRMHLHKAIVSKAKAQITALRQSLGLNTNLAASGMKILTYITSGGPSVPRKSPKGATVPRNSRKRGKYILEIFLR